MEEPTVMTLDAGGTNFIFSAWQGNRQVVEPIRLEPYSNNLKKCLDTIIWGFEKTKKRLSQDSAAISFAFPGPSDYENGIIGKLPNLTAFKGGVALGPMLEHHFKIPVFINNDGNLFAFGEAHSGFLAKLNQDLKRAENEKRYKNLIAITLGTGFGVGLVSDYQIVGGDNSYGGEGWLLRDLLSPVCFVEEHLSREGLRRNYAKKAGISMDKVGAPKDIYLIAKGELKGNQIAAVETYADFGTVLGEAIANLVAAMDGVVVLGGGISKAFDCFSPTMFKQLRSSFILPDGNLIDRLPQKIFNLNDPVERSNFLISDKREVDVPGTNMKVKYESTSKTGVGVSKHDTGYMIALGAYSFAINQLKKRKQ